MGIVKIKYLTVDIVTSWKLVYGVKSFNTLYLDPYKNIETRLLSEYIFDTIKLKLTATPEIYIC